MDFNELYCSLDTMHLLSDGQLRSISSENKSEMKSGGGRNDVPVDEHGNRIGPARDLGKGWKISPSEQIKSGETLVLAYIEGPGSIQHIWMTETGDYRHKNLRIYYDNLDYPGVESPVGDFFTSAFTSNSRFSRINSIPVYVNPGNGLLSG